MTEAIIVAPSTDPVLRVQGIEMNLRTDEVRNRGESVSLTQVEYRLLQVLMLNANRVSRMDLLRRAIHGTELSGDDKVRFYIKRLRRKLGDAHRDLIRTAHGRGYRLSGRMVRSGLTSCPGG